VTELGRAGRPGAGARESRGRLLALAPLILAAILAACGGSPAAGAGGPASTDGAEATSRAAEARDAEARRAASSEMAETPYTAEQIREATRAGRTYVFAITAPGAPATRSTMRFMAVSPEGALIESEQADADGKNARSEPAEHVSWEDLRRHAEFPRAAVTRSEAKVTVPAGTHDCFVYTVKLPEQTSTFHFAKTMPGAPILVVTEKGGQVVRRMELLSHVAGGPTKAPAASEAKRVAVKTVMKMGGQVDEKALVEALQPQLAALDPCASLTREADAVVGSLNLQLTIADGGAVTTDLQSPVSDAAKRCFDAAFAAWKLPGVGAGKAMVLVELPR
jgi:hypothetical protein